MEELKLEDFIIGYPQYKEFDSKLFDIYGDTVQHVNFRKQEFYENKLSLIEDLNNNDTKPSLLKDQLFISRFLSPKTLNDSILILGEPGTGKTIKAISVSEQAQELNPRLKKTLVLVKGEGIERNFKHELAIKYNPEKYLPKNYEILTEDEKIRRMNKLIEQNYEFHTFITFTKYLKSLNTEIIKKIYSDRVIIIDEVHNLRLQDKKEKDLKVYETIHNFLHIISNKKIVLLSATPMKDKPDEIATVMNLILSLDEQMPISREFYKTFFTSEGKLKNINLLQDFLRGKVSYIRGMESNIIRNYIGQINGDMKKINTVISKMSDFQSMHYNKYYKEENKSEKNQEIEEDDDEEEETITGFFDKSRQSSLFVYPDGSTANVGFDKYLTLDKSKNYVLTQEFENQLTNNGKATQSQILKNISKYSTKYSDALKQIIENPNENVFVYTKYVKGSGAILFGELLRLLNYNKWSKHDTLKTLNKKYVVISRKTIGELDITKSLEYYNNESNKYGDLLQVVIGSAVIGEGRSLKNVRQIHILTPHWNNSETVQAIGRGIRVFSHEDLLESERYIKIFRWCSVPIIGTSIDLYFYNMSENKDLLISQIKRTIKITAVDCQLNKTRNLLPTDKDYSNECLYKKCNYTCDGFTNPMTNTDIISDTYNLFYGDTEIQSLISSVKNLFRKSFTYHSKNLFYIFQEVPTIIVIRTLKKIIDDNIELKNRYNFPCYLRENNDFYFLVDKVSLPNNFLLNYYSQNPNVSQNLTFPQLLKLIQYKYLQDKLDIINLTLEDENDIIKQIDTFSLEIQELFLEYSYLHSDKNKKFINIIIKYFKNYIIKQKDLVISTLLLENFDKLRCLKNGIWQDCEDKIYEELDEIKEMEKFSLENSDINYYGIISKKKGGDNTEFRIKFKDEQEVEDKRKKNRGIVCSTVVPTQRISNIAINMNLKPPQKVIIKDKNKAISDILKINKKLLEAGYKDYDIKYTKNSLNNLSDDEFKTIYYWYNNSTKSELCNTIKKYFEDNDLLIYEK